MVQKRHTIPSLFGDDDLQSLSILGDPIISRILTVSTIEQYVHT